MHHCRGAQNGKGRSQFSTHICFTLIVEPLEWLILLLFIHQTVTKPLYFRFKIAYWPVHLAVQLWPPHHHHFSFHSISLYFHPLCFSFFHLFPISPSLAPVIISVTQTGAPHQSTAERYHQTVTSVCVYTINISYFNILYHHIMQLRQQSCALANVSTVIWCV